MYQPLAIIFVPLFPLLRFMVINRAINKDVHKCIPCYSSVAGKTGHVERDVQSHREFFYREARTQTRQAFCLTPSKMIYSLSSCRSDILLNTLQKRVGPWLTVAEVVLTT
jgi:hypothetical protein